MKQIENPHRLTLMMSSRFTDRFWNHSASLTNSWKIKNLNLMCVFLDTYTNKRTHAHIHWPSCLKCFCNSFYLFFFYLFFF